MSSPTIFGSCICRLHFVLKINPFTARVLDGVLKGDCNFCVCGRNPIMWAFKWKLPACTFTWYFLFFKMLENEIGKSGRNLPLTTFGSERVNSLSGSHSLCHHTMLLVRGVFCGDIEKRGFVRAFTLPWRVCALYWAPKCPYSQGGAYLQISRKGHSRVPVYSGERENIVGVLFVKSLVMLDPDDNTPIRDIYRAGSFLTSSTSEPLFELLDKFQTGKSKCCFDVQSTVHGAQVN